MEAWIRIVNWLCFEEQIVITVVICPQTCSRASGSYPEDLALFMCDLLIAIHPQVAQLLLLLFA
jgi:hypothetical protein